jgi:hypothetical protein
VAKVNVKESMHEGPMMTSTELLEAWVSSSKTDSVSDKANRIIQGTSGLSRLI